LPGVTPRRVRVPAGHIDIAPTLLNLARGAAEPAFIGRSLIPDVTGPPAPDTETRAVFQEVTSERGKKRALVTATRQLVWNAVPSDTTECYDRTRDPAEAHDIWQQGQDDTGVGSCAALARSVRRLVAGLALPGGAAQKLAQAVTPPGQTAPAPGHPLAGALGDAIVVRGYDLNSDRVAPGGTLDVTYHFAAAKRLAPGWRLFFHLQGPPAAGYRNLDHIAVDGLMPLERWRPGQVLRDHQQITIPPATPPGTYTLYLGAYRGAQRMPVTPPALNDGGDRLRLLSFTVTP